MLGIAGPEHSRDQVGVGEDRERTPPPPPPEAPLSGRGATLLWRSPQVTSTRTQPARHPLLCIAAASTMSPHLRRSRLTWWPQLFEALTRLRERSSPPASQLGGSPIATSPTVRPGEPLVVVVGGGRGGAGRTTLAVEVATALASSASGAARRVLLVDADPVHSDLDVKLGVADLDSDRCPSARIDRVLLQLPELTDRRLHLDSLLWVHPQTGVRALLAPDRRAEIGREHLDYLYSYILAPAFDAIVVDTGPALDISAWHLARPSAFWLALASSILIPLRPTLSDARSAMEGVHLFERLGVPMQRCRLVMGVTRAESATASICQRWLSDFEVVRWPWVPDVAHRAGVDHRPLAQFDRRFEQSIASLLPDIAGGRRLGH